MKCSQRLGMVVGATNIVLTTQEDHTVSASHRKPRGTNPLRVPTIEVNQQRLTNESTHSTALSYTLQNCSVSIYLMLGER